MRDPFFPPGRPVCHVWARLFSGFGVVAMEQLLARTGSTFSRSSAHQHGRDLHKALPGRREGVASRASLPPAAHPTRLGTKCDTEQASRSADTRSASVRRPRGSASASTVADCRRSINDGCTGRHGAISFAPPHCVVAHEERVDERGCHVLVGRAYSREFARLERHSCD